MTIQPKTKSSELHDQINQVILWGKFVDPASPEILAIMHEIDDLASADPDSALKVRALVLHIVGDLDGALAALDQCRTRDPVDKLVLLSNYCRCQVSQELYAAHCGPDSGQFTSGVVFGRAIGAYHKLAQFSRRAEKMQLSNLEKVGLEEIYMIDALLTEFGISDEVAGDLMQAAGAVLEEHGLMFLGNGPEVDVFDLPGELRAVHFTYRLATTAADAVGIYMDFIKRLFDTERTIPRGMHISFEGVAA